MTELLEDAILFNPMISTKKEPEDIPINVRADIMKKRKEWEQQHA